MNDTTGFFDDRRKALMALFTLFLFPAVIFGGLYLYLSDAFRPVPRVELTAENSFDQTLRVVADEDYAPYSYFDEDGNPQGLDVELMNELANRLQRNLDLKLMDLPSASRAFREGEADILMNTDADLVVNNPDMIATLPTAEKQYVVYGKRGITTVADLYGRRVASRHRMPGLGLDDEITYMRSYEDIFMGLKTGEFEFAICPIQVGATFLERLSIENVMPSYAVMHVYSSLALHPKDTVTCVRLSALLRQMQQEGRIDALERKWINHRYEYTTISGMLQNHPWFGAVILFTAVFLLLAVVSILLQHRNAIAQRAYTKHLQENLATIDRQKAQLKAQQDAILEAKDRAERSSKAKTTFLFNMSHDIRTPMNAIIGYIELAKREKDVSGSIREFLRKIEASSQHLLALINDILEMSRIENGKIELENAPMDLRRIMAEARDIFTTQMRTKGIRFTVDVSRVQNGVVLCDEKRLDRVLLNLISNAYKFTPEGGSVAVTLEELTDAPEGCGSYRISVRDSGIGMSAEFAEHVFDAFERERTSTVSRIQGTGLGMSITKSIIDLMGGSIEVITAPGEGTEFLIHVTFPRAELPAEETEAHDRHPEGVDFRRQTLLLVDDIEVNREIAKMLLEGAGFRVDTATNGKEAVEKVAAAKSGDYGAVLMDIQMPVMDGYEATKAIRSLADKELANIPILAMTANAFSEDVRTARGVGMDGHIAKPIDVSKMIQTLTEVLGER